MAFWLRAVDLITACGFDGKKVPVTTGLLRYRECSVEGISQRGLFLYRIVSMLI